MSDYNLTQRERQIVVRLLDLSQNSNDRFAVRLVDPAAAGPARELARVDFGGAGRSIELTKRDLRVLKDEGLIQWDFPDRGTGRMSARETGGHRHARNSWFFKPRLNEERDSCLRDE